MFNRENKLSTLTLYYVIKRQMKVMKSLATKAAAVVLLLVLIVELTVVLLKPSGGVGPVTTLVELNGLELLVTMLLVLDVVPDWVTVVATYRIDVREKLEQKKDRYLWGRN